MVFEAHSTDYQTAAGLAGLVENGFAILKVGPWLTFALREALYGLDAVADVLAGYPPAGRLMVAMEEAMRDAPENWEKYYPGGPIDQWLQRHFSLSDRIRYYWPSRKAKAAVDDLMVRLGDRSIPAPLISQYLTGWQAARGDCDAHTALVRAVQDVLRIYESAVVAREG